MPLSSSTLQGELLIEVADRGPSIPQEELPRLRALLPLRELVGRAGLGAGASHRRGYREEARRSPRGRERSGRGHPHVPPPAAGQRLVDGRRSSSNNEVKGTSPTANFTYIPLAYGNRSARRNPQRRGLWLPKAGAPSPPAAGARAKLTGEKEAKRDGELRERWRRSQGVVPDAIAQQPRRRERSCWRRGSNRASCSGPGA